MTRGTRDEFSPAWSPDGRLIAYRVNPPRGDEGDVWVMDRSGRHKRNLTRSPAVADWSPAFSPDGRQIAYMSSAGGAHEVWLMASDGSAARQLTQAGELSEYPTWSPDGRTIAFSGFRGSNFEVARTGADGGPERNLTRHAASDKWPAWSPDGRLSFLQHGDSGPVQVRVVNPDGSGGQNLPIDATFVFSWAPEG